jgi:sec-independent protein translocase protein TatA
LEEGASNGIRKIWSPELLIILAVVILLFGVGHISKIAGELGKGIRSFREGLKGGEKDAPVPAKESEGE